MTTININSDNYNYKGVIVENFKLRPYQADFMDCATKFCALVAGVGTGKSLALILKAVKFSLDTPGNLGLIIRKEYTDLKDSTMKDFTKYTGIPVPSSKDVIFPNGSVLMFRHGSELNVLKNINLGFVGVEQAEEFETDEQFIFLRDRLRRKEPKIVQLFLIANANGHNWIWKKFIDKPPSDEYSCFQACTFDNAENLRPDFIRDLKSMEQEAPNHYKRYVMNSHDDIECWDQLLTVQNIQSACNLNLKEFPEGGSILGIDVARFGDDRTAFVIIKKCINDKWKMALLRTYKHSETTDNNLMATVGRAVDIIKLYKPTYTVIDDIGLGGGVVDRLIELNHEIIRYIANATPISYVDEIVYRYKKDVDFFKLQSMILDGVLELLDDDALKDDLSNVRFSYTGGSNKKFIVSKSDLKKRGIRSPDIADALTMAISCIPRITEDNLYNKSTGKYFDGYKNNEIKKQLIKEAEEIANLRGY